MIDVLGAISEAGREGAPNEDGYGAAGSFAWVIDGATGLGDERLAPGPSDAAWLTAVIGEALAEHAEFTDDPGELLDRAASVAAMRFDAERLRAPRERYEIPTAAVAVVHFGARVEVAELGDCAVWIEADDLLTRFGGTESGRDFEVASARRLMAGGAGRSPEVTAFLRTIRNTANTADGYAIFAPDPDCSARARRHSVAVPHGRALLLTDGFEAGIDDYELFTGATLFAATADGLDGPLAAIRAVERDDPDLTRFPRFKPSDDATAMLVGFSVPSVA